MRWNRIHTDHVEDAPNIPLKSPKSIKLPIGIDIAQAYSDKT